MSSRHCFLLVLGELAFRFWSLLPRNFQLPIVVPVPSLLPRNHRLEIAWSPVNRLSRALDGHSLFEAVQLAQPRVAGLKK